MWEDPREGLMKFRACAAAFARPEATSGRATSARIAGYLGVQILPTFANSFAQDQQVVRAGLVDRMTETQGPRTVGDLYRLFADFMREAERQSLIRQSPYGSRPPLHSRARAPLSRP